MPVFASYQLRPVRSRCASSRTKERRARRMCAFWARAPRTWAFSAPQHCLMPLWPVLDAPSLPLQGLPPLLREAPDRWSPSASRPPSGGCPEDPDEPVALQVHDSPSGGISTVLTLTFPFPSGLTRRLPFSLASQCQPWFPGGLQVLQAGVPAVRRARTGARSRAP